jgi:hypothetical protein
MKILAFCLILSVHAAATLAAETPGAQPPMVFQTTFDCPDWDQSMGLSEAAVCRRGDGIRGNGAWTTRNGSMDQITAAANHPAGEGGKGFRHWVGDGLNNGGGGIVVTFDPTPEIWFRYYIRFQAGFAWASGVINMKTIYCNRGEPGTFYFGLHDGVIGGHVEVDRTGGGNKHSKVTWAQWQSDATGDGKFHALEVHARMNTTGTSSDGVLEYWLNGTRIYSNSAIHFASTTGATFTNCAVGENHYNPSNRADAYVDFDDLAVSRIGSIGLIQRHR